MSLSLQVLDHYDWKKKKVIKKYAEAHFYKKIKLPSSAVNDEKAVKKIIFAKVIILNSLLIWYKKWKLLQHY